MPPKKAPRTHTYSLAEFHALVPTEPEPKPSKSQKRKPARHSESNRDASRRTWALLCGSPADVISAMPPVRSRKPRNRGATKMNIWPIKRLLKTGAKCDSCNEHLAPGAIRHKSIGLHSAKTGPIVRFPIAQYQSVLCALYLLRRNIGHYDVIFLIMQMAFEPDVVAQQLIWSEQVRVPCGCHYHQQCYVDLCKERHPRCKKHNRVI